MSTVRELVPKKVGKLPRGVGSTTWPFPERFEDLVALNALCGNVHDTFGIDCRV